MSSATSFACVVAVPLDCPRRPMLARERSEEDGPVYRTNHSLASCVAVAHPRAEGCVILVNSLVTVHLPSYHGTY
jgi:hypothetical protein